MNRQIKTEHAGAKNGGGYYGRRADAKAVSRKLRRDHDGLELSSGLDDWDTDWTVEPEEPCPGCGRGYAAHADGMFCGPWDAAGKGVDLG